jgi:hypothetical protein
MEQKNKNRQKGLSLLGVIIAIFIICVAVGAILGMLNSSLETAFLSKNRLIASGLAQEGIETIRGIRDSQSDWASWYSEVADGDYIVQYYFKDSDLWNSACSGDDACFVPLRISAAGLYSYDPTGSITPFSRKITLSKISGDELKVVVEVRWKGRGGLPHSLSAEDRLWKWR